MLDANSRLYSHAHAAGLRRLSARASASCSPSPHRSGVFSYSHAGRSVIAHLKAHNVQIASPLSEADFQRMEATFRFSFPPDLRGILAEGVPLGAGFPDWRDAASKQLRMWVDLPTLGICQAVERGCFWWKPWGARPSDLHQAAVSARAALKRAPILLPVYGHCYLPASPNRAGNPVFFIHHSEATYCASDITEFFLQEIFLTRDHKLPFQLPSPEGSFARRENFEGDYKAWMDSIPGLGSVSLGWNCERDGEAWNRKLLCLSRQSDRLDQSSDVSSLSEQEQRVSKSSVSSVSSSGDHTSWESSDEISAHKTNSSEALRLISPQESGKTARRIEFWTDFVQKIQLRKTAAAASPAKIPAEPIYETEEGDKPEFASNATVRRLDKILDEVSARLRGGGWKEADISEIVDTSSPRFTGKIIQPLDRQSVLEGLALQLDSLSASMRKAGWSVEDVAETLSFDLAIYENQRKPRLKISPKLAARIAPLAASVAKA